MTELSRTEAVRLLLASRDDWVPGPLTAGVRGAGSGEAASLERQCPRCSGNGSLRTRFGSEPCERCAGSGRLRVDAYTGREVANAEIPLVDDVKRTLTAERADYASRSSRERRLAAVLAELEREELHRRGIVDIGERESWEAAKARLWRAGSYAELEHAEQVLRRFDFVSWAAVVTAYGPEAELRVVTVSLRRRAERGLELLVRLMPETIRVPPWLMPKGATSVAGRGRWANGAAQERRNEEVRRLRAEGLSLAEIGRRVGLARSSVAAILGKENGEEAA